MKSWAALRTLGFPHISQCVDLLGFFLFLVRSLLFFFFNPEKVPTMCVKVHLAIISSVGCIRAWCIPEASLGKSSDLRPSPPLTQSTGQAGVLPAGCVRFKVGGRDPPLPGQPSPQRLKVWTACILSPCVCGGGGGRRMHLKMQTPGFHLKPAKSKSPPLGLRRSVWYQLPG